MNEDEQYESWKANYVNFIEKYKNIDLREVESFEQLKEQIKYLFSNYSKSSSTMFSDLTENLIKSMLNVIGKNKSDVINDCVKIALKKNKDYGSSNILDFGKIGLLVRLNDKISRIINLEKNKNRQVLDETIVDTAEDIINYAVYLEMLSKNVWF
jgi:hypothetical protein